MQRQRVITIAPVVTDARFTVHNQRIDLQLRQACGDRKPGLPAAHNQHNRIPKDVLGGGFPEVEPIGAAKIARIGLTSRARFPDLFLEPIYFVECCVQRPCFEPVAIVGIGDEP